MKTIKKIFNMLLVVAMLLVQIVPTTNVFAEETGTITVKEAVKGETYSIYKILTLETYVDGGGEGKGQFIYRVTDTWKDFVTTGAGTDYFTLVDNDEDEDDSNLYVTWVEGKTAADLATAAMQYAKDNNITPQEGHSKVADESGTVVFEGLELGYYLVDSTLGAICGLTTTKPNAEVKEKNEKPTVTKEVIEDSTGEYGKTNDAKIGDVVEYKSTFTITKGTENYVLYDKLSTGLTLNVDKDANGVITSIVVKVNGVAVPATVTTTVGDEEVTTTNFTIDTTATTDYTFKITFNNEYTSKLEEGTVITVEYSATLNENAVIEGAGNPNEVWLGYGNAQNTEKDKTITYTYKFDLVKTDKDENELTGAEFELYDAKTDGNKIPVVLVDEATNTYRVAVKDADGNYEERVTTIKAGTAIIQGLDADTYYLEETVNPVGYNKLSERQAVKLESATINQSTGETTFERVTATVVNYTGTELPETGGIGTMLFITIGSLLVLGFGVLLVTKLRMSKMEA